jgi:hypothetical protein
VADFIHPETGEVLCSQEEWKAALVSVEERLAPIYRTRRTLREAYAERFPAPELPPKTRRTETQEKVARCPRCGERLEKDEG